MEEPVYVFLLLVFLKAFCIEFCPVQSISLHTLSHCDAGNRSYEAIAK